MAGPDRKPQSKGDGDSEQVLSSRTGISIGLVIALLSPAMAAVTGFFIMYQRVNSLGDDIRNLHTSVQTTNNRLDGVRDDLRDHTQTGSEGIRHPASSNAAVKSLQRELEMEIRLLKDQLQKQSESAWSRSDHQLFLERFVRENGLKMPKDGLNTGDGR